MRRKRKYVFVSSRVLALLCCLS